MIPRTIHQIWLGATDPEPPAESVAASESWRAAHPGWRYRLWRGDEVEELFRKVHPGLLSLYRGYGHWVQRADVARYLVLHEHGGVYADHDMACVGSFEPLREAGAVLAPTRPFGVSNDLMAACPGHPVMAAALQGLPRAAARWNRRWIPPYLRVLASTGSLYLSGVVRRTAAGEVRLLTSGEYGHGGGDQALVHHLRGSTWHAWDGKLLGALHDAWTGLLHRGSSHGDHKEGGR